MADQEYTTKIKIEADTKGGDEAAKSFEKAEAKAKGLSGAVGGVTKAMGLMNRALMGFGVVSLFTGLIAAIDKVRGLFGDAEEAARKFRAEAEKEANKKAVEDLATAYDKLNKSISDATTAAKRANELKDMERSSARELEDLNAQAAKDAELAALDPNDRYYEQKKAQIEAKYSGQAANRAAQRKVEDAETAAARTMEEAEAKGAEATQRSAALIDDRAQLDKLKQQRNRALAESVSDNAADAGTVAETGWLNFKRAFGMDGGWGRIGESRTEEGDKIRKEAEARAKDLEAQIKAKEKDIAEKERKIAELEEEAQYLSKKSVIQGSMAENAKDAASVTRAQGFRSEQAASAALSGKIESETDAARAKALLETEMPAAQERIYQQKQRIAAADASVAQAQAAYDTATGSAKGTAAQRLAQVTQTANETRDEANRLIKQLEETLSGMKSVMNAATSALNKNNSQRLTEQAQQYVAQ